MKSHSKRILSLVFALLMLFQQVMFAAQTVDLFNPELGAKTVDLIPGEDDTNTVDLLTPSEEDSTKTVDLLNPEQPSATIEQQKPIIEKNENKTVDTITPRGDDIVPAEGKKSTTTIVVGGDEIEEGETNENSEISPEEIILPEENEKEEKKDASFEDEEHHENAGVLPWSTDLVKPWSIYRAPKTVYRPGEDLDLTELLVEIKTGRSGSLYNIEDLINDEFTTITRTRKSDGQKVRLDDKIYEDETMTIHMDGCQDLTIDFTVDENLKDEAKAFEAFQQNLIREEFRNGLDFSLYLIKKGEKENPVVAYSLDSRKLTPIGNGVDKKLKDGPLFDLKDINSWDRYDIETIGKVKAILERSAELKNTENIRKKLITQLAIWNVTSNIIPEEIDATVSEPTEVAPELKPADETKENPEEDKKDEPIEITEPTTPEEETENIEKENEKVEDTKDETVEIKTEEKVEEKAETEENKESEKIEEKAPVQSTVHKIVFNAKEIDVPYDDIELSDEEYELYKELTSLEAVELKNEDEDLKIYEPIIIEETENQYADLVTIGESDIDSIERVATEVTFDAVEYSFQNLYHTLETSSMLGFGQPRDFNVLLKATMKASRKIVKGDKFEVEILSKTLPILNGEEGRANDIQIDGKVVATAEYIAEEHKIVYTFVEDLDTDKVEIEQEFKQIKEEKAALLNMLEVSENLVQAAVGANENSEGNLEELEISPEFEENLIQLKLGNTPVQYSGNPFANKKFHLKTQMTAKAVPFWKIPEGWTFDVNIGPYLKPNPDNPLKPLYDPNNPSDEVATPFYNELRHVITYTFTKDLNETKTLDIDQYLAFDTKSIGYRKEININITVSPKNYPVQSMPTIKVKGDDPRDVIESKFVVQDNTESDKVLYPYMVSYVSKQSVRGNEVTWDIDVDTTPLKKEKLDYNNIALSLYIPQNQGLSDYRVFVDNKEGTFNANGDIVLSNTTISKNSIPDTLKIKVQAKASVERDAYSLGIRITPDTGYIQKLRAELEAKRNSLNATLGPLFTVISYLKDLNYSTKFDNGFNLLDTRITATGVPENGNERAEGYNDPLRTFYSYKTNDGNNPIGFKLSETIDLRNIKSEIGSDVYSITSGSLFNFKLKDQNPNVNIYVPINNGTYKQITLGNVNKDTFDVQISNLRSNNELLPGTIIEYDFVGQPKNNKTEFSMGVKLNEREVFIEQFNAYKTIAGEGVAKFINIYGSKDYAKYRIGIYKNKNDSIKSMIFKVIETGENAYCINPKENNPTKKNHYHKKVVVEPGEGLKALEEALALKGAKSNYNGVQFLYRLKKIFYYYDKYERENNLDIINDEYTKSRIRDARQAAIFDLVNGTGKEYLVKGHRNVGNLQVIEKETIQYYNILNMYINDSSYDLSEEQLKRVKITLYPITGSSYQNVITGEVDNPVSIAKVNEKGEPLSGATFQVIKNGVQIDSWISNGQAHEIYLEPGEYILREIKAPDGYKEIENIHFSVVKNVTINNIEVVRKDVGNGPDELFHSQEKYYKNIIVIDSSNASKNINASTNGGVLSIKNKKVDKSIAVKKVDETDHDKTLPGAEFTLYRIVDGKRVLVESKLTGGDGIARFFGLQNGNYILVETKTPPQYSKIVDSIKIEVTDNGITTPGYINPIDNSTKQYIYKEGKVNTEVQSNGTVNHKAKIISLKNNTMVTRIYLNPLANNTPKRIKNNSYVKLETAGTDGNIESVKVYRFTNEQRDKYISHGDEPSLDLTNLNGFYNSSTGQNIYLFDPKTNTIDFSKTATSKIYAGTSLSGIDTPFSSDAGVIIDVTTKFTGTNGGSLKYTWAEYIDIKKPLYSVQGGSSFICEEDKGNNSTEVYNIVVANRKTTNKLVVKKVDKDSNSLKDAVFGLFRKGQNPNQEPYKKATSGIDGKAVFTDIQPGDYFVQEIQAPEGYVKIDSKINVKVDEELNITASKDDNNSLITIDEISEEEKVVPVQIDRIVDHQTWHNFINWRSELKSVDFNKNIVTTRLFLNPATDERGNGPDKQTSLTLESLQQNNKIKEIKVYKLSNYDKDGVHAETDLSSLLVNAENNSLYKSINYDSTNEPTKATLTFGSKGENDRWYGASYVIDITTGFDKNSKTNVIKANWKSDGANETTHLESELGFKIVDQLAQATVVNSKGPEVTIIKVDEKVNVDGSRKVLPGAKFEIFHEGENTPIKQKDGNDFVITGDDGKATFEDLEPGKTYIIRELDAPVGYEKTDKTWTIVVGNDNKVNVTEKETYLEHSIENPKNTINYQDDYGNPALKIASSIKDNGDGTFKGILNITSLYERNENIINSMVFELDNEHFKYKYNGSNSSYPVDKINWDTGYPVYKSNGVNVFTFEIIPNKDIKESKYSPIKNVLINGQSTDINLPKLTLTTKERVTDKSLDNKDNEFSFQVDNKYKGFEVEFKKVDESSTDPAKHKKLEGAEFRIEIKDGEKFRPLNEDEKKLGATDTCTSDANGTILFKGLKPGTYRLTEDTAPKGYHKKVDPVDFYIRESDGKAFIIKSDGREVEVNAESNKIKNIPKGTESFTVYKQGDDNKALAGVEFTLYTIDGTELKSGKTDTDGKVVFNELEFGTYILKETKTVDGYILDSTPKIINIGTDFKVPANVQGAKDVSNAFVFDEKNRKELRASEIRDNREAVVYPNSSESIFAELHYKVDPNVKIKPGDTFTIKFNPSDDKNSVYKDSVDLDGIDKTPDKEFDIYGPFGKFAEAEVIGTYPNRREIKYTVTNYVDQNSIDSIYMLYPLYINRFKYKKDDVVKVAATLNPNQKPYTDDINVVFSNIFDLKNTDKNLMAYMRELHVDTKKFKAVVYVNPKARERYNKRIFFNSNQNYNIESVKIYKVIDKTKAMPHSFGIDFTIDFTQPNDSGLEYYGEVTGNKNDFIIGDTKTLTEKDKFRYGSNAMYVLEVDGIVNTENLTDFRLGYNYYEYYQHDDGHFERRYYNIFRYEDVWVSEWKEYYNTSYRETFGQFYYPDSTAEGIRQITLKNFKNKIEFTKVDGSIAETSVDMKQQGAAEGSNEPIAVPRPMRSSKGAVLKDAEFVLKKDGSDKAIEGSKRTSDENGKFGWEGLAPGNYKVWETKAPDGYPTPKKAVSWFEVNDKGEIVKIKDKTTIIPNYKEPDIEFQKVDGNKKTVKLEGAKFTLYKAKKDTNGEYEKVDGALTFGMVDNKFDIIPNVDDKGNLIPEDPEKGYTVTSDKEGKFKFVKLEDGIYAVKETKAPTGYTKLLDYVFYFKVEAGKIIEVKKDGNVVKLNNKGEKVEEGGNEHIVVDMSLTPTQSNPIQIENFKVEYPRTGGVGTLPFVFIGMMIMMVGAYMFIRRRDALYE